LNSVRDFIRLLFGFLPSARIANRALVDPIFVELKPPAVGPWSNTTSAKEREECSHPFAGMLPMPRLSQFFLPAAIAFGVAVYFALALWIARPVVRALIGWDACIVALLLFTHTFVVRPGGEETMRRIAEWHGKGTRLLVFSVLASIASIAGLATEAAGAKAHHGAIFAITLGVATILLSWVLIQTVFALRYAHQYFLSRNGKRCGGLNFGEPGEPDFWDFIHFSIVLGAAAQTADIVFASREMRRIGTLHTLVAFGFNTAILATLINVLLSALPGQ
jgi:uncharacterized membrane protein